MATETDIRIARAVALKAAVDLVNGNAILLADLPEKTEELAALLLQANGVEGKRPPGTDPGPAAPDQWPDDREAYAEVSRDDFTHQGPVGQAAPHCAGCNAVMEYKQGDTWTAYFCPQQQKSVDKNIQAEQKKLHPPVWL